MARACRSGCSERARAAGVLAVLGGLVFYILAADTLGFHLTGIVIVALLGARPRRVVARDGRRWR